MIELLVVLGLFSIVGGITLIVGMDSFRGYNSRSERNVLVSTLQKARSQSVNNMCFGASCTDGRPHGVHIEPTRYVIFQGSSWSARDQAVDEVVAPRSKSLAISGATDVIFSALSGSATTLPSQNSAILLTDTAGGGSSSVEVNTEGRICADASPC